MTMKIIYLIQSETYNFSFSSALKDTDCLLMIWGDDFNLPEDASHTTFHLPNSSWAQGRNELYRRAQAMDDYDYFIFCDDDIEFNFELKELHQLLSKYQPFRAVPDTSHTFYLHQPAKAKTLALKYVEHSVMALSAEAAQVLMPYSTEFDKTNWWLSSEEFCKRCWLQYPWQTLKYNTLNFKNTKSRSYPKSDYLGNPENEFKIVDLKEQDLD